MSRPAQNALFSHELDDWLKPRCSICAARSPTVFPLFSFLVLTLALASLRSPRFAYSDNHNVNSVMFLNEHRDHVVVGGVHGDGKIRVWEVERACTVVETFYGSEERTKGGEGISYRRVLGPPTETTVATTVQVRTRERRSV